MSPSHGCIGRNEPTVRDFAEGLRGLTPRDGHSTEHERASRRTIERPMKPQAESAPELDELAELIGGPATLGFDGPVPTIDELVAEGDPERLLELGAVYRVGAPFAERDAFKALECFEAASRLGSAEAEYLLGVAYADGLGIGADLAEGAKRLRSAAQRGSLRAKIYVANLYEMGVHYQADREKADVWYRNVARTAGIDAPPDTEEYDLALAETGCVRHCLRLVADEALPAKDRAFYLKKAKAMGYHHRLAMAKRESKVPAELATPASKPEPNAAPAATDAPASASETAAAEPTEEPAKPVASTRHEPEEPELGAQWTWGAGLGAAVAAAFFLAASTAAGVLAMEGSRALAAAGRALPVVGAHHEAVFFAVLASLGVFPASVAYRGRVLAIALGVAGAAAAGGYYAFDAMPLVWDRLPQAVAAGLVGFWLVLSFLGVLAGTRARAAPPTRPPARRP
jgi:hypothetical protein